MNCKRVRELILADYLDGELGLRQEEALQHHLAQCWQCKKFATAAQKVGDELFACEGRVDPPEFIWHRIKEAILAERRQKSHVLEGLFSKLKYLLYIPKSFPAVTAAITFMLVVGAAAQFRAIEEGVVTEGSQEQTEYSISLTGEFSDAAINTTEGYGTSIERYFL